jgi:hypothetical protein
LYSEPARAASSVVESKAEAIWGSRLKVRSSRFRVAKPLKHAMPNNLELIT